MRAASDDAPITATERGEISPVRLEKREVDPGEDIVADISMVSMGVV